MLQKAEVSTEFIACIGILLLFFVFFVGIIGIKNQDINESIVFKNAQNILNIVTSEINTASRIEGYHREFSIPDKLLNGETYNVTYNKNLRMVKIEWSNGKNLISNIITGNITGNITVGNNRIENVGGEVKINES